MEIIKKTTSFKAILGMFLLMGILLIPSVLGATTKSFTPDLSRISKPVKGVELIPEQFKTNYGTYTIEKGYWVCVNVAYDMKPSKAYQTCVHECSHKAYTEIFAEWCEDDFEKCLGVVEK